ncbi:UNVERIFIED_CONTAM: hypothetical protein DES50_10896 [Williamsia faeni]
MDLRAKKVAHSSCCQRLGAGLVVQIAGRLVDRIDLRRVVWFGLSATVVAMALMTTTLDEDTEYLTLDGIGVIMGIGIGATLVPLMTASLRGIQGSGDRLGHNHSHYWQSICGGDRRGTECHRSDHPVQQSGRSARRHRHGRGTSIVTRRTDHGGTGSRERSRRHLPADTGFADHRVGDLGVPAEIAASTTAGNAGTRGADTGADRAPTRTFS